MKTKTRQEFHWIMIGSVTDLVMVRKKSLSILRFYILGHNKNDLVLRKS